MSDYAYPDGSPKHIIRPDKGVPGARFYLHRLSKQTGKLERIGRPFKNEAAAQEALKKVHEETTRSIIAAQANGHHT